MSHFLVHAVTVLVLLGGCLAPATASDEDAENDRPGPPSPNQTREVPAPVPSSDRCRPSNLTACSTQAPDVVPFDRPDFFQRCRVLPITLEGEEEDVAAAIGRAEYEGTGLSPATTSLGVWTGTCDSVLLDNLTVILGARFWFVFANVYVNDSLASQDPTAHHLYALELFFEDERLVQSYRGLGFPVRRATIGLDEDATSVRGSLAVNETVWYEFEAAGATSQSGPDAALHFLHHSPQPGTALWASVSIKFSSENTVAACTFRATAGALGEIRPASEGIVAGLLTPNQNVTMSVQASHL